MSAGRSRGGEENLTRPDTDGGEHGKETQSHGARFDPAQAARFRTHLEEMERSQSTVEKYVRCLGSFYAWLPADKQVDKETVLAYKAHLCGQYAPSSVNTRLAALRMFFRCAGWTDCAVKLLRIQRRAFARKERELSRPEYERLVAAARARDDERMALLLQTMASTGIRVSETRYITVEAAQRGQAEIALKGKIRVILLPGKLCRQLLKYARRRGIASGPVICTRSGRPMNRKEIWAQMKGLCAAAGVEAGKVFPHNLRHLLARTFYRAQRDLARLADLLGHSSVETTRIYLSVTGEEHLRHIEGLGLLC